MHRSLHELGIDKLSVADRIALAQDIWDSVAESVQHTAPSANEAAEIDRRLAEDDDTPEAAVDWQKVRSAAQNKWSRN